MKSKKFALSKIECQEKTCTNQAIVYTSQIDGRVKVKNEDANSVTEPELYHFFRFL